MCFVYIYLFCKTEWLLFLGRGVGGLTVSDLFSCYGNEAMKLRITYQLIGSDLVV